MNGILIGSWPTTPTLRSAERDRSQRLAVAEARAAERAVRRDEADGSVQKMLASFWRRAPRTNRSAA